MDNGKVAEVTSLQIPVLKMWQITSKGNGLYFPGLHAFSKVWLKLNENCGSSIKSNLLKLLTAGILQNAPNDPN